MLSNAAESIEKVAERLDRIVPEWATMIDPYSLDLSDTRYCILGQTFRNHYVSRAYSQALFTHFKDWLTPSYLEGTVWVYDLDILICRVYEPLWLEAIDKRLNVHPLEPKTTPS